MGGRTRSPERFPEQPGALFRAALVAGACLLAACGGGAPTSEPAPSPGTPGAPSPAESPATALAAPDVPSGQELDRPLPEPRALTAQEMQVYRQAVQAGVESLNQRRYPEALAELQKATELQPDNPHTLRLLGNAYAYNNDLGNAQETLELCLRLDPANPAAHFELAQVALARGDYELAMDESQKTLELDPRNPRAHEIVGMVLYRRGEEESAIDILQSVVSEDPSRVEATYTLGLCYQSVGRFEESRNAFQAVVQQARNHQEAYFNLGKVLAILGDEDGAEKANAEFMRISEARIKARAAENIAHGVD